MFLLRKGMLFNWDFYTEMSTLTPVKMFLWRTKKAEFRNNAWFSDSVMGKIPENTSECRELTLGN